MRKLLKLTTILKVKNIESNISQIRFHVYFNKNKNPHWPWPSKFKWYNMRIYWNCLNDLILIWKIWAKDTKIKKEEDRIFANFPFHYPILSSINEWNMPIENSRKFINENWVCINVHTNNMLYISSLFQK